MKKFKALLSLATLVFSLSVLAITNQPVKKASAGACSCKNDPGDTCVCYDHTYEDCDETCWLCNDDCNES